MGEDQPRLSVSLFPKSDDDSVAASSSRKDADATGAAARTDLSICVLPKKADAKGAASRRKAHATCDAALTADGNGTAAGPTGSMGAVIIIMDSSSDNGRKTKQLDYACDGLFFASSEVPPLIQRSCYHASCGDEQCTYVQKKRAVRISGREACPHRRDKRMCALCDGRGLCSHGRMRYFCKVSNRLLTPFLPLFENTVCVTEIGDGMLRHQHQRSSLCLPFLVPSLFS